jgi:GT2 family glycosyltransferase
MIAEGEAPPKEADLLVLLAQCNRGFAAGCNLGLKTLIAAGGAEFYVLLNPDALLCEGALAAFAERLSALDSGPCGASVLTYDSPHRAQAFGGASQDRLTLQGENIGAGERLADAPPTEAVEARMSYPLGCALAFRDRFLRDAGFLDERYFLYYEEADWTLAGGKQPLWARDAVVYHRYGGASKSRSPAFRSSLAEYHMARSRLLFALKWRPHLAPLMLVLALAQAGRRLLQGRFNAARALALGAMPGASSRFAG